MKRIAVLLLLVVVPRSFADEAPRFSGKTAREWMLELGSSDLPSRINALNALHAFGPDAREAVPLLLLSLKDRSAGPTQANVLSPFANAVAAVLAGIGPQAVPALVKALESDHVRIRAGAALALGQMRPAPMQAVGPLRTALKDRDEHVRHQAALALVRMDRSGESVVPVVSELLRALTPGIRLEAVSLLRSMGPAAKSAAGALVESLHDEHLEQSASQGLQLGGPDGTNHRPQHAAVQALASIGPDAVPALMKAATDKEPRVRSAALLALASIRPQSKEAVPVLRTALKDGDPGVRLVAAINYRRLTRDAEAVVPILRDALKDADPGHSGAAALALAMIGRPAREVIPTLIEIRKEEPRRNNSDAALMVFGSEAVPEIVKLLADETTTADGVVLLKQMLRDALPAVLKALGSNRAIVRAAAAEILGVPGPHAIVAIPALRDAARDQDARVRFAALESLARLDFVGPHFAVVVGLSDFVGQKNFPHRRRAVEALGGMGKHALKAASVLEPLLDDPDVNLRRAAARSIHAMKPDLRKATEVLIDELRDFVRKPGANPANLPRFRKEALPQLVPLLKEPAPLRVMAMTAIGQLGQEAHPAAPSLAALLKDRSLASRAASILLRIGDRAAPYLPELEAACRTHPDTRTVAHLTAMAKLGKPGRDAVRRLAEAETVRAAAVQALAAVKDRDEAFLTICTAGLKSEDPAFRQACAFALMELGRSEAALPVLTQYLKDPDINVRRDLLQAASEQVGESSAMVPFLVEALRDRDSVFESLPPLPHLGSPIAYSFGGQLAAVGQLGVGGIGQLGFAGQIGQLGGPQLGALGAGGMVGGIGSIPISTGISVRASALSSLARVRTGWKPALPAVTALLQSDDPGVRATAAATLAAFGPGAMESVVPLKALLKDNDIDVRRSAAAALAKIDRTAEVVPILIDELKDPTAREMLPASGRPLARCGRPAIAPLVAMLRQRAEGIPDDALGLTTSIDNLLAAHAATGMLEEIGPDAEDAVEVLREVLIDRDLEETARLGMPDYSLRFASARALGRIGPKAKRVAPALLAVAKDQREDIRLRAAALGAVVRLDPPREALALTEELLHGVLLYGPFADLTLFDFIKELGPTVKDLAPLVSAAIERLPPGPGRAPAEELLRKLKAG